METDDNSSDALGAGEHAGGSHQLQSPGSARAPTSKSECTKNCNRSNCGFLFDDRLNYADADMVCVSVHDEMEGEPPSKPQHISGGGGENVQLRRGVRERKRTSNGGAQNAKKPRPAAAADEDKEMRRGVRERKRTSNGGAQNAKKHRPAAAADEDKENSRSAGSRCDRKRASKEEAQNPKKSRSAVAKDDELEDVFAFFDTHFEKPTREMQKEVAKKKAASKGRLVRDKEVWILRVALGNDAGGCGGSQGSLEFHCRHQ